VREWILLRGFLRAPLHQRDFGGGGMVEFENMRGVGG